VSDMQTTILRLLRATKDAFISGEQISHELNISRTAVWKQISRLRQAGYDIRAISSRGYRLVTSPDTLSPTLISAELSTTTIGSTLVVNDETISTNSDAMRLAEQGAAEGTTVCADSQQGGKGRLGRVWASPPRVNLYCSIILRPQIMPYQAPQLTFLSAVAVAQAIEITTGISPEIKWPNDVLIKGRKIAGLLNEMSAETDGINFVILGIGINLNMTREQFPPDLRTPATSLLLETGEPVVRSHVAAVMLNQLDHLYNQFLRLGFEPVRAEWQARCNANGRRVEVSDGGQERISGLFAGIDDNGAMLVELDNGKIERIYSGDVRVL